MRRTLRKVIIAAGCLATAVTGGRTPLGAVDAQPPVGPAVHEASADPQEVELIRQLARRRGGRPDALAQFIQMTAPFGDAAAAAVLEELAVAHLAAGELNLAAEARQMMFEQYPAQPQAQQAALWLVRMYASSEVGHARRQRSQGVENIKRQLSPAMQAALSSEPAASAGADGSATGDTAPAADAGALYACQLASQAATHQPALGSDAAFAFARSVAARRAGQPRAAQALLTPLKHRAAGDVWGDCARAEAWLQDPEDDAAPKPTATCLRAAERPRLDGMLDEACWSGSPKSLCKTADVRLAYDDRYLYLAVCCAKRDGVAYPRDDRPRPHDGDVASYDHVRLALDLDRDYATWFELTVDSRGWTADRCAGDASWNPRWYVAAAESNVAAGPAWIVEAAIPLAELTTETVTPQSVWACAAARVVPSASPSAARDLAPPDFTLLRFSDAAASP
ncbi:MAG: hypothetical protein DCC67_16145 [Planctomycetota bacterium]|nr:MAG: hypothetical protein DCC67_16145 [Planctomycetota bacterium]